MKSKKTIASLLAMTLLTFAFAQLPLTAIVHAQSTHIVFLTHWTDPKETEYWDNVIKYYMEYVEPDVTIERIGVDFATLFQEITLRHLSGNDADIMSMHGMWVPAFANWKTQILAQPPTDVIQDIKNLWTPATVTGVTYKGLIWGYPSEYNTWALVYNRAIFQKAIAGQAPYTSAHPELQPILNKLEARNPYQPLDWIELKTAARALARWESTPEGPNCTLAGFAPFVEGMPEEQRYQFSSLLWSNGGNYIDTAAYKAVFNDQKGHEVMQLYHDLGYVEPRAYNPQNLPGYWDIAWTYETVGMMILPTWMTYIRDNMAIPTPHFDHLGVAPIPIGPSGSQSYSAAYSWILAVSQKAKDDEDHGLGNRYTASWNFLKWLTTPQPAGLIPASFMPEVVGAVPKGDHCTLLGDFYTYDSIIPARLSDQETAYTTEWINDGATAINGTPIKDDFWFKGFMDMGAQFGKVDKAILKAEEAQAEVGLMFEKVILTGADVDTTVDTAAGKINSILPIAGDIDFTGHVDVSDAVILINDWGAAPGSAKWNLGRSDTDDDALAIGIMDAAAIIRNYG